MVIDACLGKTGKLVSKHLVRSDFYIAFTSVFQFQKKKKNIEKDPQDVAHEL